MSQLIVQSNFQTNTQNPVSLPLSASISDLRNVVCWLKKKPHGISVVEIRDIFRRRLFEPCKLMSYEAWGIVNYQQNVISLSELGWQLANSLNSEAEIYRMVIKDFEPYFETLRWIAQLEKNLVISSQVISFWNQGNFTNLIDKDDKVCENSVISFFHLCHAAGLGIASVGRKGQPTRLELDSDELFLFLKDSSSPRRKKPVLRHSDSPNQVSSRLAATPTQLLVSCGNLADFSPSIREILEITDIPYQLQIREDSDNLLSIKTHEAMQNCTAALIIANEKGQVRGNGPNRLNDRLLCEIVASYALFETRVLLIWQGSSPPLIPLKGLIITCLDTEFDWPAGIELCRKIKELKYRIT